MAKKTSNKQSKYQLFDIDTYKLNVNGELKEVNLLDIEKNYVANIYNNNKDVLNVALSDRFSSGISLHSSHNFKDSRQREYFVLQPSDNITDEYQKRGRVDRVGQKERPIIYYPTTSIYAERKFIINLKNKIESLESVIKGIKKSVEFFKSEYEDVLNYDVNDLAEAIIEKAKELQYSSNIEEKRIFYDDFLRLIITLYFLSRYQISVKKFTTIYSPNSENEENENGTMIVLDYSSKEPSEGGGEGGREGDVVDELDEEINEKINQFVNLINTLININSVTNSDDIDRIKNLITNTLTNFISLNSSETFYNNVMYLEYDDQRKIINNTFKIYIDYVTKKYSKTKDEFLYGFKLEEDTEVLNEIENRSLFIDLTGSDNKKEKEKYNINLGLGEIYSYEISENLDKIVNNANAVNNSINNSLNNYFTTIGIENKQVFDKIVVNNENIKDFIKNENRFVSYLFELNFPKYTSNSTIDQLKELYKKNYYDLLLKFWSLVNNNSYQHYEKIKKIVNKSKFEIIKLIEENKKKSVSKSERKDETKERIDYFSIISKVIDDEFKGSKVNFYDEIYNSIENINYHLGIEVKKSINSIFNVVKSIIDKDFPKDCINKQVYITNLVSAYEEGIKELFSNFVIKEYKTENNNRILNILYNFIKIDIEADENNKKNIHKDISKYFLLYIGTLGNNNIGFSLINKIKNNNEGIRYFDIKKDSDYKFIIEAGVLNLYGEKTEDNIPYKHYEPIVNQIIEEYRNSVLVNYINQMPIMAASFIYDMPYSFGSVLVNKNDENNQENQYYVSYILLIREHKSIYSALNDVSFSYKKNHLYSFEFKINDFEKISDDFSKDMLLEDAIDINSSEWRNYLNKLMATGLSISKRTNKIMLDYNPYRKIFPYFDEGLKSHPNVLLDSSSSKQENPSFFLTKLFKEYNNFFLQNTNYQNKFYSFTEKDRDNVYLNVLSYSFIPDSLETLIDRFFEYKLFEGNKSVNKYYVIYLKGNQLLCALISLREIGNINFVYKKNQDNEYNGYFYLETSEIGVPLEHLKASINDTFNRIQSINRNYIKEYFYFAEIDNLNELKSALYLIKNKQFFYDIINYKFNNPYYKSLYVFENLKIAFEIVETNTDIKYSSLGLYDYLSKRDEFNKMKYNYTNLLIHINMINNFTQDNIEINRIKDIAINSREDIMDITYSFNLFFLLLSKKDYDSISFNARNDEFALRYKNKDVKVKLNEIKDNKYFHSVIINNKSYTLVTIGINLVDFFGRLYYYLRNIIEEGNVNIFNEIILSNPFSKYDLIKQNKFYYCFRIVKKELFYSKETNKVFYYYDLDFETTDLSLIENLNNVFYLYNLNDLIKQHKFVVYDNISYDFKSILNKDEKKKMLVSDIIFNPKDDLYYDTQKKENYELQLMDVYTNNRFFGIFNLSKKMTNTFDIDDITIEMKQDDYLTGLDYLLVSDYNQSFAANTIKEIIEMELKSYYSNLSNYVRKSLLSVLKESGFEKEYQKLTYYYSYKYLFANNFYSEIYNALLNVNNHIDLLDKSLDVGFLKKDNYILGFYSNIMPYNDIGIVNVSSSILTFNKLFNYISGANKNLLKMISGLNLYTFNNNIYTKTNDITILLKEAEDNVVIIDNNKEQVIEINDKLSNKVKQTYLYLLEKIKYSNKHSNLKYLFYDVHNEIITTLEALLLVADNIDLNNVLINLLQKNLDFTYNKGEIEKIQIETFGINSDLVKFLYDIINIYLSNPYSIFYFDECIDRLLKVNKEVGLNLIKLMILFGDNKDYSNSKNKYLSSIEDKINNRPKDKITPLTRYVINNSMEREGYGELFILKLLI